jgi:hypothetical protein
MTIENRALRKAAELLGTRNNLAERLGITVEDVEKWISGTRRPPREVFLRVVDIILDEMPAPADSSDPPEPPPTQSSAPVVR